MPTKSTSHQTHRRTAGGSHLPRLAELRRPYGSFPVPEENVFGSTTAVTAHGFPRIASRFSSGTKTPSGSWAWTAAGLSKHQLRRLQFQVLGAGSNQYPVMSAATKSAGPMRTF